MNTSALHTQAESQAIIAKIAKINGEVLTKIPDDLFIPPEALEVFLETFEGPLDLLLYLIRKQNIDILNIPIVQITEQYVEYVELMHELKIDLAADYLVMAATLAEIKSRLLLPQPKTADEDENIDPRAELIKRLQEYERFKEAAHEISELPQVNKDNYLVMVALPEIEKPKLPPVVEVNELARAYKEILMRANLDLAHEIDKEVLSVREKMAYVLDCLRGLKDFTNFTNLLIKEEGVAGLVTNFLAILELAKDFTLKIQQNENYGPIYIRVGE